MIFDHRTYTCQPGTIKKQLALYEEHGLPAQSRNLGGPFLDAGAKTVVLSSSDVSLASAMALSEAIYAGLAKGHSMAVALRDARRTLVESERFADPYYWGLTYAFGLGE